MAIEKQHTAVARVERDGDRARIEIENVALQGRKGGGPSRLEKVVLQHRALAELEYEIDEVPPRPTEFRQEWMPDFVVGMGRRCLVAYPLGSFELREIGFADNVTPVLTARIEDVDRQFDVRRQREQQAQLIRRHGGDSEECDALRQARRSEPCTAVLAFEASERSRRERGPVLRTGARGPRPIDTLDQRAPEQRLPGFIVRDPDDFLPVAPTGEPIGAVDKVLIEDVDDALRQLIALHAVGVVRQVARETPRPRVQKQTSARRKQREGMPEHQALVEGRLRRHVRLQRAQHLPDERGRQRKVDPGCDALRFREAMAQPGRHARALHDDDVAIEHDMQTLGRVVAVAMADAIAKARHQIFRQQVEPIGLTDLEHGAAQRPPPGPLRAPCASRISSTRALGIASRRPRALSTVVAANSAFTIASSVASAVAAKSGDKADGTRPGVSTGTALSRGRRTSGWVEKAIT